MRLRSERFRDQDLPLDGLAGLPGLVSCRLNAMTGSLLVEYDPEAIDPAEATRELDLLDPGAVAGHARRRGLAPAAVFAPGPARRPAPACPGGGSDAGEPGPANGGVPGGAAPAGLSSRQTELWNEAVGMGVSMLALLATGFLGARKLHIVAGMGLIELAAKHAWRYRKRLIPPRPRGRCPVVPTDDPSADGDHLLITADGPDGGGPKPPRVPGGDPGPDASA
jgi:hypothetical protein